MNRRSDGIVGRQVEVYLNVTFGSAFMAYLPSDRMRCAWRGTVDLPEDNDAALAILWARFNMDPDPDDPDNIRAGFLRMPGYEDRSVSCADVITLDGSQSYAVEGVGWKALDDPRTSDEVVGPEGDDLLRQSAEDPEAARRLTEGIGRMSEGFGLDHDTTQTRCAATRERDND